jgi:hypothetical protein
MKKILILIFILFGFLSCKKLEKTHKITYEIKMLQIPSTGSSNFIEVMAEPCGENGVPGINRFKVPKIWKYDYFGLRNGDKVMFSVDAQQSYRFEMKIYIDDIEVSYLKVKTSDNSYYLYFVEERNGINDWKNSDLGFIEFVYQ